MRKSGLERKGGGRERERGTKGGRDKDAKRHKRNETWESDGTKQTRQTASD